MSRIVTLLCLGLAIGTVIAAETAPPLRRAPAHVELRDQFDAPQTLAFPRSNIVVLLIADRKGSEQVDGWIAWLKPRYSGRVDFRGLAAVGGAPAFVHGRIRKKFQETRSYPVMMDWSGKVCPQFGYEADQANVLVLGRNGTVEGRFTGKAEPKNAAELCAVLDRLLLAATRPK